MARVRAIVGAVMTSALVVACNLLSGVGDLEITTGDASAPDSGRVDSSSTDAQLADAKVDIDTGPPPTCPSAGHSCTKAPPSGWDGPFLVYIGDASSAPACPTEIPASEDGSIGDPTGAFECECKCGGVANAKCTAFLDEFNGTGCVDPPAGREDLASCRAPGSEASFRASVDLTNKGACPASAAFKSKADPVFDRMVRFCKRPTAFASDGCTGGDLCVPDGVAPFNVKTCIANADATQACPAPWTDAHRFFNAVNDTRACNTGSCTCDDPTGTACTGGKLKAYGTSTTCQGPGPQYAIPLAICINVGAGSSQKIETAPTPTGGSCNPHGEPDPDGQVAGAGGGVVCCAPQ